MVLNVEISLKLIFYQLRFLISVPWLCLKYKPIVSSANSFENFKVVKKEFK